jgi:serine protease Do
MKAQRTLAALAVAIAAFGLGWGGFLTVGYGAEKAKSGSMAPVMGKKSEQYPYLGIGVEPVSPTLVSHLPKTLTHGQGLVVMGVAKNSPAENAGLKVHDILMSYGDQKLFAPTQLVGLVDQDKAGHEVSLSIVRGGTPLTVKVTLGTYAIAHTGGAMDNRGREFPEMLAPGWFMPRWHGLLPHHVASPSAPASKPREWESFDSMTIKKLGEDRFHVEIQYLNEKGGLDRKTFEGSREEIRTAIDVQKDLPAVERRQLLHSLDLPTAEDGQLATRIESELKDLWDREFPGWTF